MNAVATITRRPRAGFTLIESAVATVLVGSAVSAMCCLLAAGLSATSSSGELTRAIRLADAEHEMRLAEPTTRGSPGDDRPAPARRPDELWVDPDDGARDDWSRQVTVEPVAFDDARPRASSPARSARDALVRLTVAVSHRGKLVYTGRWLMEAPMTQRLSLSP